LLQVILYCALFLICALVFAEVRSRTVRQAVLLLSSYVLYLTWGTWFIAILLFSTGMNFLLGRWLRRTPTGGVLATAILLNLALLSSFKYLPGAAVHFSISSLHMFAHLALPLGISFWTFQAMSYLFDIYRGEELDPTLAEFALYMVFFPVSVSGPICRMPDMLPQFRSDALTPLSTIGRGFRRMATGIFMLQAANMLGNGIMGGDGIASGFDHLTHWSGADVWCLAVGAGLQLFLNFAGYSHIAIGAALALGFTVPENFDRPFQSTNPSVFWTRWHMSLSFWIRDYVFLPLAMLRREVWWRNLALVIAMVLFGLWHQATVLFVLWGFYQGVLLVAHRQVQKLQRALNWEPPPSLWIPLSWITTIALISLGWIFFRANSLAQAREMLAAIVSPTYFSHSISGSLYLLVAGLAVGYAIVLLVIDALDRATIEPQASTTAPRPGFAAFAARWRWYWVTPLYVMALLVIVFVNLTQGGNAGQFMYRTF
jgi:D-alanyl-lipoteichoic acid acyltransferase DltB (MBOAT superfamily)